MTGARAEEDFRERSGPARDRLLVELHGEAVRLWGKPAVLALPREHYRDAILMLALDRIARGECAGLLRRKPATVANLREEKLRRGID